MKKPAHGQRARIGFNVAAQVLIALAMAAMVNAYAFRHFARKDFSQAAEHELSPQTRRILKGLKGKARAYLFFSPGSPVYGRIDALLKEFQYASGDRLTVEIVDPYKNFGRARELQAKYKFGAEENIVILDFGERSKLVREADLADLDNSGVLSGQPPRVAAFKGEQALAGALLELTEKRQNQVLYLRGHGQIEAGKDGPLSGVLQLVERQNIKLEETALSAMESIPPGVAAVIIAGARYDPSEREIAILKRYWENGGRLLVLLDPDGATPRLQAFLAELGVQPADDRVLRTVNLGENLVGILRDVNAEFEPGAAVTRGLRGAGLVFLGATQSLRVDLARASEKGVHVVPLIRAGEGFWGETEHKRSGDEPVLFTPKTDHGPPLTLAVSMEKGAIQDERVKVGSSRMVVVGNAGFLHDDALTEAGVDFFLSATNWLLDRERLIGISAKPANLFTLNLAPEQMQRFLLLCLGFMPAAAGTLGLMVWWKRRR